MSLNDQLAGRSFGPAGVSWSHKDAILYALGIGAGGQDALGDLELTTENSLEVSQEVFPTFPLVLEPEFDIPYGLCTYGISARLAVALLGASPWQLEAVGGRFTAPVTPGDTLRVDVWRASAGDAVFRTSGAAGTVVIDRGWIRLAEAGAVRPR
jgi:MaoC like domain